MERSRSVIEKIKNTVLWFSSERGSKRRRRDGDIEMALINNDVLEEIMLRLPVKTLTRFQSVSKDWRSTIESKSFKERFRLYQETQEPKFLFIYGESVYVSRMVVIKTMRFDWSSNRLIEKGPDYHIQPQFKKTVRVTGSCDGLVCFLIDNDILTSPIIVANPAMRRSQNLPLSMTQLKYLDEKIPLPDLFPYPGFGKDSVTDTYKLVWLYDDKRKNISSCEVFDFEVKIWRYVVDCTPLHDLDINQQGPIFAKGLVYWLTQNKMVLAYNLHTEMFRVIKHSALSQASCLEDMIMSSTRNGHLWITDTKVDDGIQHFWRIKNALDLEWESEKMFSIDLRLTSSLFPKEGYLSLMKLIWTSNDNKKVLISDYNYSKLIWLLPNSTSQVFNSVSSTPGGSVFTPFVQCLDFPL